MLELGQTPILSTQNLHLQNHTSTFPRCVNDDTLKFLNANIIKDNLAAAFLGLQNGVFA